LLCSLTVFQTNTRGQGEPKEGAQKGWGTKALLACSVRRGRGGRPRKGVIKKTGMEPEKVDSRKRGRLRRVAIGTRGSGGPLRVRGGDSSSHEGGHSVGAARLPTSQGGTCRLVLTHVRGRNRGIKWKSGAERNRELGVIN